MIWQDVSSFFIGLLLAVVVHEAGHAIALRFFLKRPVKVTLVKRRRFSFAFKAGRPEDYAQLSPSQKYDVYLAGVGAGAVLVGVFAVWFPVSFVFLLLVAYLIGSRHDFELMFVQLESIKKMERDANAGENSSDK